MYSTLNKRLRSVRQVDQASEISLPDDLLIHILISLPVEDVLRCRCVCRKWRNLTSTKYFGNMHSQNIAPVILVDAVEGRTFQSNQILLSKWWETGTTRSKVRILNECTSRFSQYAPHCSGDGLLVLKSEYSLRKFTVFNPVCGKKVIIVFPRRLFGRTEAFAIYFHPIVKEYCILWAVYWMSHLNPGYDPEKKGVQYMILVLGPKPYWKKIRNPWMHKVRNPYKPTVLLGRYLYWLVKPIAIKDNEYNGKFAIMEFDILCEELKVMPSPVSHAVKCYGFNIDLLNNENISLLDVGGLLSLFLISPKMSQRHVYQWTLMSPAKELWTISTYHFRNCSYLRGPLRAVALMDENLLIQSFRVVVLNLKLGTVRKLGLNYSSFSTFFPHAMSLASLSSCNSKITIKGKDDEIIVEIEDVEDRAAGNSFWRWGNVRRRLLCVAHPKD